MVNKSISLKCPKCHLSAKALLDNGYKKFIIYTCPKCGSNVVFYKDKTEVISDRLMSKLLKKKRLKFCGSVKFNSKVNKNFDSLEDKTIISKDDIINLKILLETETDIDKVISKL